MKKGFTLVEVLTTIVLMGVFLIIAIPSIDSVITRQRKKMYENHKVMVKDALKTWGNINISMLPEEDYEEVSVTLAELKNEGLIDINFRNPINNKCYSNSNIFKIAYVDGKYIYSVDKLSDGTDIECDAEAFKSRVIPKLVNDIDEDGKLSLGDAVSIGSEYFYVLAFDEKKDNNYDVYLIAVNKLNVGYKYIGMDDVSINGEEAKYKYDSNLGFNVFDYDGVSIEKIDYTEIKQMEFNLNDDIDEEKQKENEYNLIYSGVVPFAKYGDLEFDFDYDESKTEKENMQQIITGSNKLYEKSLVKEYVDEYEKNIENMLMCDVESTILNAEIVEKAKMSLETILPPYWILIPYIDENNKIVNDELSGVFLHTTYYTASINGIRPIIKVDAANIGIPVNPEIENLSGE